MFTNSSRTELGSWGWASMRTSGDLSTRLPVALSVHYITIPQVKYILAKRFTLVDSSKVPCLRALSCNDLLVGSFQRGCTPITQQETSPSYEAPWPPRGHCRTLISPQGPTSRQHRLSFSFLITSSLRTRFILMNPWGTHTTSNNILPPAPMAHPLLIKIICLHEPWSLNLFCNSTI